MKCLSMRLFGAANEPACEARALFCPAMHLGPGAGQCQPEASQPSLRPPRNVARVLEFRFLKTGSVRGALAKCAVRRPRLPAHPHAVDQPPVRYLPSTRRARAPKQSAR